MRRLCTILSLGFVVLVGACGNGADGADADPGCAISGEPELAIGVPNPVTFVDFEPLNDGDQIPLSSNGQTFLAVQLAVKARNLNRFVYIGMSVTYTPAEGAPRMATKDDTELERLLCQSDDRLYLIPVVVDSSGLGDDLEIADKPVDVSITLTDEANRSVSASASGVLSRI